MIDKEKHRIHLLAYSSVLMFLFFPRSIFSQSSPYKIINANLQEIYEQKRNVLTGNVILKKDSIDVFAHKAVFLGENRASLYGAVKIINGSASVLHANRAKINGRTNLSRFYKNVVVETDEMKAKSDSMWYDYQHEQIHFFENVEIFNKEDSSQTFGNRIITEDRSNFTVYDSARYVLTNDSMTVRSDTLFYFAKENNALAVGNVTILRNHLRAEAKRSRFNRRDSIIKLYGEPIVYFENSEIRGDSIFAFMSPQGIKHIDVHGSAYTINIVDSASQKFNRILGQDIYLYFEKRKIKRVRALQNAISIHYFLEEESDNGTNSVSADSLHIDFSDGKVVETQIFGGIQGVFYPPKYKGMIKDDY